jgi:hypothetical protein
LDQTTAPLKSISVLGRFVVEDARNIALTVSSLLIDGGGSFEVGSESAPYRHNFTLRLLNPPGMIVPEASAMRVRRGKLGMFGKPGVAWTALNATLSAGSALVSLMDAVDWSGGTRVLVTGDGPGVLAEEFVITSVSGDGHVLGLDHAALFTHTGGIRTIVGKTTSHAASLLRNVAIEGNPDVLRQLKRLALNATDFSGLPASSTVSFEPVFDDGLSGITLSGVEFRNMASPVLDSVPALSVRAPGARNNKPVSGILSQSFVKGCLFHELTGRGIVLDRVMGFSLSKNVIKGTIGSR